MNIREALEREHSKRNTMAIVTYIGHDPKRFATLVSLFGTNDHRLVQRAAWPLSYVAEHHPELVYPHLGVLLERLDEPLHDAYKRNVFRLLRGMKDIPEEFHARIIDACMKDISNSGNPAAIRAFAIHIMGNMLKPYPDLANELALLLEPLLHHELASLRSSARNVLKQIGGITG